MKLFISYAHVDKPICKDIVAILEDGGHVVWYDERLRAGAEWWDQIVKNIHWCEGFVYLLSPESVDSEYCQKEYALARELGRLIFPIKIQSNAPIPSELDKIQYVDFSEGLTPQQVARLMGGFTHAEREAYRPAPAARPEIIAAPVIESSEGAAVFALALDAYENGRLDEALFKFLQVKEIDYTTRFFDVDDLLAEVKGLLDQQAYMREAERHYTPILQMVRLSVTRKRACQAFGEFQVDFPDYDPEGISGQCKNALVPPSEANQEGRTAKQQGGESPAVHIAPTDILPPPFEWVEIPAGLVSIGWEGFGVQPFYMAKYPTTYAQIQVFIDAEDGFHNPQWWEGLMADVDHKSAPGDQRWKIANHPRENVSWFDAVAYTRWLSEKLGKEVRLPTEWEWQWAAQGDTDWEYPYGNTFDKNKANTKESDIGKTTPVDAYPSCVSFFGVLDMSGNVWEWCLNEYEETYSESVYGRNVRVLRGGSWYDNASSARVAYRNFCYPRARFYNLGFRLVVVPPSL